MSTDCLSDKALDFYQLVLTDFTAAVEKYVDPDIIWENPLPDHIPFGGVYSGIDGMGRYLTMLSQEIEMEPLHFTDVIANGNVVVCIGVEADTKVLSTGKSYTMPCVHVLRFNDEGKIVHVREYNDTKEMIEAFH